MKCNEFEKLEMKYMDGTLTSSEKEAMHRHTEECAHCQKELALYSSIMADFEKLPLPTPDESFTPTVMAAVRAVPKPTKGLLFLVICSVISAVSSVAGFLNLVLLNRAELVDTLSDNSMLMPFVKLINLLASADNAISELISSVFTLMDIYMDSLIFGALAITIIAIGIYTALRNSVFGGIKK